MPVFNLSRLLKQLKDFCIFLGRRSLFFIFISFISSIVLIALELLLSATLIDFLQSLHLVSREGRLLSFFKEPLSSTKLCIFLIVIAGVRAATQIAVNQSGYIAADNLFLRLRLLATYEMLLAKPSRYISSGLINLRMAEIFPRAMASTQTGTLFLMGIFQCIGIAGAMFFIAFKESVFTFVALGCVGMGLLQLSRGIREAAIQTPIAQSHLIFGIQRAIRNWLLIRIYKMGKHEHAKLAQNILQHSACLTRVSFLGSLNSALLPSLGIVIVVALVFVSQTVWSTEASKQIVFLYLLIRLVATLSQSINLSVTMLQCRYQLGEAMRFFQSFPVKDRALAMKQAADLSYSGFFDASTLMPPPAHKHSIKKNEEPPKVSVENLYFSYRDMNEPVLTGFSFSLAAGKQLGIVGPSGSGKSTLLALILGIIEPDKGSVTLGHQDPKAYFSSHSSRIGYVGAEQFLVEGSIRENLKYGNDSDISDSEINDALKSVQLYGLVQGLSKGLDHQIAENGDGLSAGQKQRLSLARSLLRRPTLLILDEASANLDSATELEIAASIHKLKDRCTTIIVSHRPGLLRYADQVIDMTGAAVTL